MDPMQADELVCYNGDFIQRDCTSTPCPADHPLCFVLGDLCIAVAP